jgi:hypothetical protein
MADAQIDDQAVALTNNHMAVERNFYGVLVCSFQKHQANQYGR